MNTTDLYDFMFVSLGGAQKYKDAPAEQLIEKSTYFQRKYDGNWGAAISTKDGEVSVFSKTGKKKITWNILSFPPETILVGEYIVGTQWATKSKDKGSFMVFDCPFYNGGSLAGAGWFDRIRTANFVASLGEPYLKPTEVFSKGAAYQLFEDLSFEGVVGRNDKDLWSASVLRYKHTFTEDCEVIGRVGGQGKFSNTLGALVVKYPSGATGTVGGGFTDSDRTFFWDKDYNQLIGMVIEVGGKGKFTSGELRHPAFIRIKQNRKALG